MLNIIKQKYDIKSIDTVFGILLKTFTLLSIIYFYIGLFVFQKYLKLSNVDFRISYLTESTTLIFIAKFSLIFTTSIILVLICIPFILSYAENDLRLDINKRSKITNIVLHFILILLFFVSIYCFVIFETVRNNNYIFFGIHFIHYLFSIAYIWFYSKDENIKDKQIKAVCKEIEEKEAERKESQNKETKNKELQANKAKYKESYINKLKSVMKRSPMLFFYFLFIFMIVSTVSYFLLSISNDLDKKYIIFLLCLFTLLYSLGVGFVYSNTNKIASYMLLILLISFLIYRFSDTLVTKTIYALGIGNYQTTFLLDQKVSNQLIDIKEYNQKAYKNGDSLTFNNIWVIASLSNKLIISDSKICQNIYIIPKSSVLLEKVVKMKKSEKGSKPKN